MTLTGRTLVAGVIGWPVAHSRSPRLHGHWLARYGVDGVYVPFSVPPGGGEAAVRALAALGIRGANVTVPHKEVAARAVDRLDSTARRMGAVNLIVVGEDGSLEGRNTDGFGFIENLKATVPGWRGEAGPAVVLGAGGAARAVLVSLLDAGVPEIRLVNRSRARAEGLAEEFGGPIRVGDWVSRETLLDGAALLVNTTTLGMGTNEPLDLDLAALPPQAIVYDIVYNPLVTPLLERARACGNPTVGGLGMLLHQARPAFAAWFGIDPVVDAELERVVLEG